MIHDPQHTLVALAVRGHSRTTSTRKMIPSAIISTSAAAMPAQITPVAAASRTRRSVSALARNARGSSSPLSSRTGLSSTGSGAGSRATAPSSSEVSSSSESSGDAGVAVQRAPQLAHFTNRPSAGILESSTK